MNAILQLTAHLYAPLSTAQYFANAHQRLIVQCPRSVKHEAKLPSAE